MSRERLARKHASPLSPPKSGLPLIRSTPDLGYQMVRIKGTIDVETGLSPEAKKKRVYWAFKRFVEWMEKEGHHYKGNLVIHGPFPHIDFHAPDVQMGDRGGSRLRARNIEQDMNDTGKQDYVLEAHFLTREHVQEVPLDVAMNVIGSRGVRAARPNDLKGLNRDE